MNEKLKSKVEDLKKGLSNMRPLNQGELKRLYEEFSIYNCYHSNAIEGNTLTLHETAMILQEGITIAERPLKDHLEAIGHKDAFEYMLELVKYNSVLSESVIKTMHSLILMHDRENKGIYRRIPVRITGTEHNPTQPYLIEKEMEDLLISFNENLDKKYIIENAAEFHLKFENIHPFIDGNGRTGRIILNFELMKSGLLPVNIKFADRFRYYNCFTEYVKTKQPDLLADMIAEYEIEELERYIDIVNSASY
ncbi:MAG: Fic family protein [Clostridium sp.]|nr:Fic family protein [Clostridium sp.]